MFKKLMSTTNDGALTILRLMLGVVFFAHGSQKMLGWFGGYGLSGTMHFFTDMMHIPAPFAFLAIAAEMMHIPAPFAFLAIAAEFFGGIGLILGLLTRVAAFGIACNMVAAIVMVHRHFGLFANWSGTQKGEGIEYHLLTIAIAVALMIRGAGALSADAAIAGSSAT